MLHSAANSSSGKMFETTMEWATEQTSDYRSQLPTNDIIHQKIQTGNWTETEFLGDTEGIRYELIMRQQPKHARMCGFGEKDRRPIDPPPIVQLIATNLASGERVEQTLYSPSYVLHAGLWLPDMQVEHNLLHTMENPTRVLMGSLVSSVHLMKDVHDRLCVFFVFPDLSVRLEGNYRLRFTLVDISGPVSKVKASIFSDIFTVYQAKKFPGMMESTELSRCLSDQGLKLPIRKDGRFRRSTSNHNDLVEETNDFSGSEDECADYIDPSSA